MNSLAEKIEPKNMNKYNSINPPTNQTEAGNDRYRNRQTSQKRHLIDEGEEKDVEVEEVNDVQEHQRRWFFDVCGV